MTRIGFERAQEYASWLADRLGRPARLPTVQEARELAATAEADGNTLGLWAGYRPNPDDAERLLESVSGMGDSPLLLPVGSRPPAEGAPIFDLGGNAAEWVVDETGGGVAFGPSADRSTDEANRALPKPAYTGFRVVVSP